MHRIYILTLANGDQSAFLTVEDCFATLENTYSAYGKVERQGTRMFQLNGIVIARGEWVRVLDKADHL